MVASSACKPERSLLAVASNDDLSEPARLAAELILVMSACSAVTRVFTAVSQRDLIVLSAAVARAPGVRGAGVALASAAVTETTPKAKAATKAANLLRPACL